MNLTNKKYSKKIYLYKILRLHRNLVIKVYITKIEYVHYIKGKGQVND